MLALLLASVEFTAQAQDRLPENNLLGVAWVNASTQEIVGLRCLSWSDGSNQNFCERSQLVTGSPTSANSSAQGVRYIFEPIGKSIVLSGEEDLERFHQNVLRSLERTAHLPVFDSVDPWNHLESAAFLTLDHPIAWALLPFAAILDLSEVAFVEAPQAMHDQLQKKRLLRRYHKQKAVISSSDVTFQKLKTRVHRRIKLALVDASYQM